MREKLDQKIKTKVGEEPKLLFELNDDDEPVEIFVLKEPIELSKLDGTFVTEAVLVLIASYFLLNLNYPEKYSQILGLFQHCCLNVEVLENRKTRFIQLLSVL